MSGWPTPRVAALRDAGVPAEVTHLELRTLAVDLANHLATRVPGAALREAFDAVCAADGVIAVTPVFNGSYSGLFKLFFDALDEGAMKGRPVLLAATGGTARHSLVIEHAMLPLFYYLKALVATAPGVRRDQGLGHGGRQAGEAHPPAAEAFAPLVLGATRRRRRRLRGRRLHRPARRLMPVRLGAVHPERTAPPPPALPTPGTHNQPSG